MTLFREIVLERIAAVVGEEERDNLAIVSPEVVAATGFPVRRTTGRTLFDMASKASASAAHGRTSEISGVIAATFSNEVRFPSLAVRVADALGLPDSLPAFDIQMACSAYPYALSAAGQLAAATGGRVLVVDGDVQSRFAKEPATEAVASDACTATLVSAGGGTSRFAFYSGYGEQLKCAERMEMDGFGVFTFVATEVRRMLEGLLVAEAELPDWFVPHQANMYMVRRLAKSLKLEDRLLTGGGRFGNAGSASVPLTIAQNADVFGREGCRILAAGFGAGLSAAAGFVRIAEGFTASVRTAADEDLTR